jgi:hypothetical protein
MSWHLAQVNVGILLAPIDSPEIAGFKDALEPINALADGAPGFVWRLQTEDGDATAVRAFDDPSILMNMSVWTSLEALAAFVYDGDHLTVMRQRRSWFTKFVKPYMALWWVPAGTLPTEADAVERLEHLEAHGSTSHAFTFRQAFGPPALDSPEEAIDPIDDRWGCPTG